jgi:hypothetical protein
MISIQQKKELALEKKIWFSSRLECAQIVKECAQGVIETQQLRKMRPTASIVVQYHREAPNSEEYAPNSTRARPTITNSPHTLKSQPQLEHFAAN